MPPTYNLVESPFIPCSIGERVEMLGLRDTLLRAHEIRELRDPSPLVTLALHRLLLAIIYRVAGSPRGTSDWQERWEKERFDSASFEAYFDKWRHRFDLFDSKWPFYQDTAYTAKDPGGANQVVRELSRGNNATLFDHTHEDPSPVLPAGLMARALIAEQAFAIGGGKSELGYTSSAPAAGGVLVLVQSECLFGTLLLNLFPHGTDYEDYFDTDVKTDRPSWEADSRPILGHSSASGYLDYLTWQSRSVKLHPLDSGEVQCLSYAAGRKFEPSGIVFEPMSPYEAPDADTDFRPVRYSKSKDLWRDCASLFHFDADANSSRRFLPPQNLRWIRTLSGDGILPSGECYGISTFGLCTDKAKVNFWRHETLPLPLDYLSDPNLVGDLKRAIALAESVGDLVRFSVATVAKLTLTADPTKSADKNRQWQMVDAIGADALYWSRLERPFREFLVRLPGELIHRQRQARHWLGELKREATRAYSEAAKLPQLDARGQRAVIEGEAQLYRGLAKIENSSPDLKPTVAEVIT